MEHRAQWKRNVKMWDCHGNDEIALIGIERNERKRGKDATIVSKCISLYLFGEMLNLRKLLVYTQSKTEIFTMHIIFIHITAPLLAIHSFIILITFAALTPSLKALHNLIDVPHFFWVFCSIIFSPSSSLWFFPFLWSFFSFSYNIFPIVWLDVIRISAIYSSNAPKHS